MCGVNVRLVVSFKPVCLMLFKFIKSSFKSFFSPFSPTHSWKIQAIASQHHKSNIKGTVSVISSDPQCKDGNA